MRLLYFVVLLFVCFSSCRKDEVVPESPYIKPPPCDTTFIEQAGVDTVFPSSYLAMAPGSWWNYDNGTNLFSFEWVQIPHKTIETNEDDCVTVKTSEIVLPKTSFGLIYGDFIVESHDGFFHYTRLVGAIGVTQDWSMPIDYYLLKYKYETIGALDSIVIYDEVYHDILVTQQFWEWYESGAAGGPIDKKINFFAKNVGLVYQEVYWSYIGEWQEKSLTNYHISPY